MPRLRRRFLAAALVAAVAVIVLLKLSSTPATLPQCRLVRSLQVGRLMYREVAVTIGRAQFTVRCASGDAASCQIEPIDVHDTSGPQLASARQPGVGAIVNGGYFDDRFHPVGLFRRDGIEIAPASDKLLLNATLLSDNGVAWLAPAHAPEAAASRFARQCGPMLIDSASPDPLARPGNWTAAADRTAILIGRDRVGLLTASPCSLADLQTLLRGNGYTLGVPNILAAANLDGGPSSGMLVYDETQAVITLEPRGRITDALALIAR